MATQNPYNIGAGLASRCSIPGQAASAGTITGNVIDLQGETCGTGGNAGLARSMKVALHTGASTGSPSAVAFTAKVQHCDTSGGTYADFKPDGTNTAQSTSGCTAVNSDSGFDVNLNGAKRYIKLIGTVALTGGTTPTLQVSAECVLGGFPAEPLTTPAA